MTQRLNYAHQSPELFKKLAEFSGAVKSGVIDKRILSLVEIRTSQINGCAFCLDMHIKEARIHGERELRIHHLSIWHESPLFDARERAALAWAEAVTRLPAQGVPDDLYSEVCGQFSEKEISDLTFAVMAINAWNRASIAFRAEPGSADKLYGLEKADLH